ncbi:MAG: hypothetical protein KDB82_11795 [Planctomycetes bacterium]|nr:hypothetical protein [Planctomycetota bacterium]
MSTNRLPKDDQEPQPEPGSKLVVVQTPMGVLKLMVPATTTPDGRDPLAVAMEMFQNAVDSGADDPLMETLVLLKHMADEDGNSQPLTIGLMVLKQMADNGMLPPMKALIEGTGISEADLKQAFGIAGEKSPGIIDKLDQTNLN